MSFTLYELITSLLTSFYRRLFCSFILLKFIFSLKYNLSQYLKNDPIFFIFLFFFDPLRSVSSLDPLSIVLHLFYHCFFFKSRSSSSLFAGNSVINFQKLPSSSPLLSCSPSLIVLILSNFFDSRRRYRSLLTISRLIHPSFTTLLSDPFVLRDRSIIEAMLLRWCSVIEWKKGLSLLSY